MAGLSGGNKPKAFGIASGARPAETARMKVGLLSDTHNHLPATRRALELLLQHGAQHLIHCGDSGEDVLTLLSAACLEHGIHAHVAIGNCDRVHLEDAPFQPCPAGLARDNTLEFILDGKRCLVLHGDREEVLRQAVLSGRYDYVFAGHTHAPADIRRGRTRLLNPGSPVRPRQGSPVVAVLDLAADTVVWFQL